MSQSKLIYRESLDGEDEEYLVGPKWNMDKQKW